MQVLNPTSPAYTYMFTLFTYHLYKVNKIIVFQTFNANKTDSRFQEIKFQIQNIM